MKNKRYIAGFLACIIAGTLLAGGCSRKSGFKSQSEEVSEISEREESMEEEKPASEEKEDKDISQTVQEEPEIIQADWSEYFNGLEGAAVLYDVSARSFFIFNSSLAMTRRSPCSTFKIISSAAALEHGIIEPDNSVHKWSGEVFWNENWNKDIGFKEAFRESCVWYFREVTDELGQELMQEEIDRLSYGNCDISDWEGRLNTNNNNRALTGFWLESSLAVSPKEQTEVMERIFGEHSVYSDKTRSALKEVMLVEDENETDSFIYGKTGMGMKDGAVVDAWFTGFMERSKGNVYFCVYYGKSDTQNVSSALARETAVRLLADY